MEQKASVYTNLAFDDQNNAKHFFLQTNFEERQNKDVAAWICRSANMGDIWNVLPG